MSKSTTRKEYSALISTNMIIAVLGGLLIVAFSAVYLVSDYQRNLAAEQERLRAMTSTVASRTQSIIGTVSVTLRILDEWCARHPDRDPRFDPEFNALINVFRDQVKGKVDIKMVRADGGIFFFPSTNMKPLADASDREYFLAAKSGPSQELYFSAPIIGRVTHKWQIPISYRVRPNAANALLFYATINFENLNGEFADLLDVPERSVSIVRKDQTVLYRLPFSEHIVGKKISFTTSPKAYDLIDVYNPGRTRRAIFYQELDGLPLYAMVADSYAHMQRAWLKTAALKASIALAILAGFLLLNARLIRLLVKNDEIRLKLEIAARFDSLTGLKNRRYFFERVSEEMERAKRQKNSVTLAIADIDHFKAVNDGYGHPAGDEALKEIAAIIAANVRAADIAGRIGGEEFAILFPDTKLEIATEAAERIRLAVQDISVGTWKAGISLGLAQWRGHTESIDALLKRADDALYAAKNAGRNRVVADEDK
jgi:diguanylate cyclase (GGDEF)-like protein